MLAVKLFEPLHSSTCSTGNVTYNMWAYALLQVWQVIKVSCMESLHRLLSNIQESKKKNKKNPYLLTL